MMTTLQLACTATALALVAVALSGCKAREMAVAFSPAQSTHVDSSWLIAAKSCWPMLGHSLSDAAIRGNLEDPLHFRNTFSTYASLSDATLIATVSAPVFSAPSPDSSVLRGAATPFLSRLQASTGAAPNPQVSSSGEPPADTLCAVHPGTPIGFK